MRETLSSPLRTLALLEAIVADRGTSSVSAIARATGLPVASAHRHVAALIAAGFLVPAGYGRHIAGPRLGALAGMIDDTQLICAVARPLLDAVAKRTGCVVQLGTFDNEMVTYRLKAGHSASVLFTRVGMQLEAYCSGIGKVLLAYLPEREQAAYLANGPFPALTDRTITDPDAIRKELATVRVQGFAADNEEVARGLCCLAVPILSQDGKALAALSASHLATTQRPVNRAALLHQLRNTATAIQTRVAAAVAPLT